MSARNLQPLAVAAARIFGTRVGNVHSLRSGNKVMRREMKGAFTCVYVCVRVVVVIDEDAI